MKPNIVVGRVVTSRVSDTYPGYEAYRLQVKVWRLGFDPPLVGRTREMVHSVAATHRTITFAVSRAKECAHQTDLILYSSRLINRSLTGNDELSPCAPRGYVSRTNEQRDVAQS